MSVQKIELGTTVRLRADGTRQGAVISILPSISGEPRYRVFHGPQDVSEYFASQLVPMTEPSDHPKAISQILDGELLDAEEFLARLTAARLSHPQVDSIYSMHAARIQHIPFQFKPLLRLLRADRPRLLIADEVGVGKTIEAGLILKELQARQRLNTIAIVCPKSLVSKWRSEMRRFDEDFSILSSAEIRYCVNETYLEGSWPTRFGRAIMSLEAIRQEEVLLGTSRRGRQRGLLELDPPPRFDLIIVDEVHHIRNSETRGYAAIQFITESCDAAVFLSATPVHVGARNLYTLLNLLRPDLFRDESVFSSMVEPNGHLTTAMQSVRSKWPEGTWHHEAWESLDAAAATSWGRHALVRDPRFEGWRERLNNKNQLTDTERVRCIRELEEVHTLSHVMNRTRRRDIGRFTIREPHTISEPFTSGMQLVYDTLLEFRRDVLSLDYDPRVVRLISDTLERQAASCLPALLPSIDSFLRTGRFSRTDLTDAVEDEEHDFELDLPPDLISRAHQLQGLVASVPPTDPKRDRLLEIARIGMELDGPGKLLVFSYFLHTLDYLQMALAHAGYRVAVISGRVHDAEREELRDRFRMDRSEPQALDILLSSEVGCEGLDYEFCDRLVNYDIPWNPMRIEQRIGRIDRFGQQAEKVHIFNFITPGTVEERIFFRCFERLGVFRDTVGDLEAVLGELVPALTRVALDPSLSAEQAETKALQEADNALRRVEEERLLEMEGVGLVGLDDAFQDDIATIQTNGRFVSGDDLRMMLSRFLAQPAFEGRILSDERAPSIARIRLRREARDMLHDQVHLLGNNDRPTSELLRWLNSDDQHFAVTFDQQTATTHRNLPFITPIHPLAKVAIDYWQRKDGPLIASLSVSQPKLNPGNYLFICEIWDTIAIRPDLRLMVLAWDIEQDRLSNLDVDSFLAILPTAIRGDGASQYEPSLLENALSRLNEHFYVLRQDTLEKLLVQNDLLVAQRMASLNAYYHNRIVRIEADLRQASQENIIRMRRSELARVRQENELSRAEIEARRDADITTRRVAFGILEVSHAK